MAPLSEFPFAEQASGSHVGRRDFLKTIIMAAAAVGLPFSAANQIAEAIVAGVKPSVIWLHFQECTGCTESLLRANNPDLAQLILQLISLDYHETLAAAAGTQVEAALHDAMERNAGKYVCVVEGSIPTKEMGIYCKIGGRTATEVMGDVAGKAGAIIAIGSCASWGGVQSSSPNPTGAVGVPEFLGKKIVTIPGCPPNPYNFLGVVLQYVTFGKLPALDELGRPMFAYGRVIHTDCPRRSHYDTGRFAERFGDANHRQGYCLYKLGCKGPVTHANCSLANYCNIPGTWPVGTGHPCVGCTEKGVAFTEAIFKTADIPRPRPSWLVPPIQAGQRVVSPLATGVGGLLVGAGVTAATLLSERVVRKLDEKEKPDKDQQEG